jgi:PPOX class probable F420-dependent enzyme
MRDYTKDTGAEKTATGEYQPWRSCPPGPAAGHGLIRGTGCYRALMTSLPDSARAVLKSPALAHLVTLNPDGSPQVSIVWVGLDGDQIVAGHLPEHRKVRNVRNDRRVALSIETGQRNAMGLTEYLVIYGTARITEEAPQSFSRNSLTPTSAPVSASRPWTPAAGYITHIRETGLRGRPLGSPALTPAYEPTEQIIRI